MGTNYYWHYNHCDSCGRQDVRHICKSLISFEGYFKDGEYNEHTRQYDADMPVIASWQDWKNFLTTEPGRIFDEYGREHEVETFIKMVEATDPTSRRRQYDWIINDNRNNRYPHPVGVALGSDWIDDESFSFHGGEFS